MRRSRFTEEQIVAILEEGQRGEQTVDALCPNHAVQKATYYSRKKGFSDMAGDELQRLIGVCPRAPGILSFRANSIERRPSRRSRRPQSRRSGRIPALAYPPLRPLQS